jgi:hypothetical protein
MSMRKKLYVFLASALVINFLFVYAANKPFETVPVVSNPVDTVTAGTLVEGDVAVKNTASLYDSLQLNQMNLSRNAFDFAMRGYNQLLSAGRLDNSNLVSIVDFSLPSSRKRLFIIDLKKKEVVFNTYVAHGRNSGKEMASQFSNEPESNKSSLGLYITGGTYIGKHGFSLHLAGQEKGINDNANSRAIVMHSAAYVSESAIKMQGFIGRSLGCPALPENLYRPIIEKIKNGSCLFLYSPDKSYAMHSVIAKKIA